MGEIVNTVVIVVLLKEVTKDKELPETVVDCICRQATSREVVTGGNESVVGLVRLMGGKM